MNCISNYSILGIKKKKRIEMVNLMILCEKEVCVICAGVFFFFYLCERLIERQVFGECRLCDFQTVKTKISFRYHVREEARGFGHPVGC